MPHLRPPKTKDTSSWSVAKTVTSSPRSLASTVFLLLLDAVEQATR